KSSRKLLHLLSASALSLLTAASVSAADRTAVASGSWNDSIWGANGTAGAGTAAIPGSRDNAYIKGAQSVTIVGFTANISAVAVGRTNATLATLTIGDGTGSAESSVLNATKWVRLGNGTNMKGLLVVKADGLLSVTGNNIDIGSDGGGTGNITLDGGKLRMSGGSTYRINIGNCTNATLDGGAGASGSLFANGATLEMNNSSIMIGNGVSNGGTASANFINSKVEGAYVITVGNVSTATTSALHAENSTLQLHNDFRVNGEGTAPGHAEFHNSTVTLGAGSSGSRKLLIASNGGTATLSLFNSTFTVNDTNGEYLILGNATNSNPNNITVNFDATSYIKLARSDANGRAEFRTNSGSITLNIALGASRALGLAGETGESLGRGVLFAQRGIDYATASSGADAILNVDVSAFAESFTGTLKIALFTSGVATTNNTKAQNATTFTASLVGDSSLIDEAASTFGWEQDNGLWKYVLTLEAAAVPEPATTALFLAALGLSALALRRRTLR
ncbi:MAG: PEP-CTERM sorting domain-containing protein, partial [Opitutaceae bacterium]|nr:PEP-CTERM sorting domain-containing protein [Opitutaceae bacterium]